MFTHMNLDRSVWNGFKHNYPPVDQEATETYSLLAKIYQNEELDEFFDEQDLATGKTTSEFLIESVNGVNTLICNGETPLLVQPSKKDQTRIADYFRSFGYSDGLKLVILKNMQENTVKEKEAIRKKVMGSFEEKWKSTSFIVPECRSCKEIDIVMKTKAEAILTRIQNKLEGEVEQIIQDNLVFY